MWLPRFRYWRFSVLAGAGQQRAPARRSETARDGLLIRYLGGIPITLWPVCDALESRLRAVVANQGLKLELLTC